MSFSAVEGCGLGVDAIWGKTHGRGGGGRSKAETTRDGQGLFDSGVNQIFASLGWEYNKM